MLTRESSTQVTPASVRLLNANGVPYFWPLRLSRRAGGASLGGEARKAAALLPAATCCGCGAGAGAQAPGRSAAAIRGAALTIAPTKIRISPWFRTMGAGYRQMPARSATRKKEGGRNRPRHLWRAADGGAGRPPRGRRASPRSRAPVGADAAPRLRYLLAWNHKLCRAV